MLAVNDERRLLKEAADYAKSNKIYDRILREILLKYESIGRFTGSIRLTGLNEEDSLVLGAIDYKLFGKKEVVLSVRRFIDYFKKGRFAELNFEAFMKEYFKQELKTNKEKRDEKQEKQFRYFEAVQRENAEQAKGVTWLSAALIEKAYGHSILMKEYTNDSGQLKEMLRNIMRGLEAISFQSDILETLPIFSSRITKDPHYFDIGTTAFKLLLYGICYHIRHSYPQSIEDTNEVLYSVGIARDEISIATTVYGIRGIRNNVEHAGWTGFFNNREPFHVSIENLNHIEKLYLEGKYAYIFENPAVFMEVIRRLNHENVKNNPALICTKGQLNTASLMLLDKLNKEGVQFYYSGDFDPEGLIIADKLKTRYKEGLILWRYSIEDYLSIKGNINFEHRTSQLRNLVSSELAALAEEMIRSKVSGYQELLIERYVEDIHRNVIIGGDNLET